MVVRLLVGQGRTWRVRGTTLFLRRGGALTKYGYILLPLITGGKPGTVYSTREEPFGMRLRRDLRLALNARLSPGRGLSGVE